MAEIPNKLFVDHFSDDRTQGEVIHSRNAAGVIRKGIDVEGVIAIDHSALRIQPLLRPGWQRAGLAYGPYPRENGLAFAVSILNGHQSSHTDDLDETIARRIYRWIRGSQSDFVIKRLMRWTLYGNKKMTARQMLRWCLIRLYYKYLKVPEIHENLSIGWFANELPENPPEDKASSAFVVHADGWNNGDLWALIAATAPAVINGIRNIPFYLIVVLRERGAIYYLSSVPGVPSCAAFPRIRAIAIDVDAHAETLYAGVQQSVLGEVGFRLDTRLYSTQVVKLSLFEARYGGAHSADSLTGRGEELNGTHTELGDAHWAVDQGKFLRSNKGVRPLTDKNRAMLIPDQTSGLIHIELGIPNGLSGQLNILWRFQDDANHWRLQLENTRCTVGFNQDGIWQQQACCEALHWQKESENSLQIQDDGEHIRMILNGHSMLQSTLCDRYLQTASGLGFSTMGQQSSQLYLCHFEAHPRDLPAPPQLDMTSLWFPDIQPTVISDCFQGTEADLSGHTTTTGNKVWRKEIGKGIISINGQGGAQVKASAANPNPQRTAYTLAWNHPAYADIEVTIIPPGEQRGQKHRGRGGIIFWQDARNYIIINTWLDDYCHASVSSFFYLNGYEDLYNAVWVNVGEKIRWGEPYQLRVVFNGRQYWVFVDGEPVIYRALTDVDPDAADLTINRLGLVANWEWGHDTGTRFEQLIARA